jgi:CubicO group peptidase (beta-lactamase class C family)
MSSGIRYEEQSLPLPWGDDVNTYYGTDLRDLALNGTEIERAPGQEWHYNNYSPLLLGLVLERSTGMSVSEYIATRLWQPLGAGRACGVSRLGLRRWKAASTRHRSTTRASAS